MLPSFSLGTGRLGREAFPGEGEVATFASAQGGGWPRQSAAEPRQKDFAHGTPGPPRLRGPAGCGTVPRPWWGGLLHPPVPSACLCASFRARFPGPFCRDAWGQDRPSGASPHHTPATVAQPQPDSGRVSDGSTPSSPPRRSAPSEICGRMDQSPSAAPSQPYWWQVGPCPMSSRLACATGAGARALRAGNTRSQPRRGRRQRVCVLLRSGPRKMTPILVWPGGRRLRAGATGPQRRACAGASVCRAAAGWASAPPVPAARQVHVFTPQQELGSPRAQPRARKPHEPIPARA